MTSVLAMSCPLEICAEQAQTDGAPTLPRFSMVAYTGGKMRLGGWRHPVIVDLAGMQIPSQRIPIQYGHDMSAGVGHTERVVLDGGKLLASGIISRKTAHAEEIVASSRNGFPWQASIGASADQVEFVKQGEQAAVNGQTVEGPVNIVRASTLGEISFVPLGADNQTTASVAARKPEQEGRGMTDLKERRAALIQAHGEQHAGVILAALVDGKDDAEISAEIQAANHAALVAERDAAVAQVAQLQADLEAIKASLAERETQLAGVKAARSLPAGVTAGSGESDDVQVITRVEAAKMTKEQLAAWKAGKLRIE
jgi:hypothetical protein